jgi:hypothetical protein
MVSHIRIESVIDYVLNSYASRVGDRGSAALLPPGGRHMEDPRIALIAIRSGDGEGSQSYEAIVVGTGEGGGTDWRYAIFDLPQLRDLFTAAAQARQLGAPAVPHPLSSQTDVLARQFGARWYETSTNDLLGNLEQSAFAANDGLTAIQKNYLAQKLGNVARYTLALPLRDIVKVVFYRNNPGPEDKANYGQPDDNNNRYNDENRDGGPLAVLDTCRNVIAKGGTRTPRPPQKFQEQDSAKRSADRLGPVYIHRVHSTLATKLTIAAKHLSVFS